MRALKLLGILIMLAVLAATVYVTTEQGGGVIGMNFREFTRYAGPAFCAGALLVAINQFATKMAAREKKEGKGEDTKKPA